MGLYVVEVKPVVANAVEKNDGYCPCSLVKVEDTKCMCKEFREQDHPGKCHCGRYEKVEETWVEDDIYYVAEDLLRKLSDNYGNQILDIIIEDVIADVKECSALSMGGNFSDGDVSLAIGRVLLRKMGEMV